MAASLAVLGAKIRSIAVECESVAANADNAAAALTRMRQSSQDAVKDMQASRQADAFKSLREGLTAGLWEAWWMIANVDANSPGLSRLEIAMREWGASDIGFLQGMKREMSRIQQLNRRKNGGKNGRFDYALTSDQASAVLNEYAGGNP